MRCITIKSYQHDSRIYCVRFLSDRAFSHGFRIVNPEFNTSIEAIEAHEEQIEEYMNTLDNSEYIPKVEHRKPRTFHPNQNIRSFDPNRRTA